MVTQIKWETVDHGTPLQCRCRWHWVDLLVPGSCFPDGSVVKTLPAMQETQEMQVQSLGWEDPLEKEMATHSSIPVWKILCSEEPGMLQSMGLQSQT